MDLLQKLGWNAALEAALTQEQLRQPQLAPRAPARVVAEQRGLYRVWAAQGELRAELAGNMRHEASAGEALPTVGDWVGIHIPPGEGAARIDFLLPRRSRLVRKAAGTATGAQLIAANVDRVLVLHPMAQALNRRRIERSVALVWESGATPVVVLSKADLGADLAAAIAESSELVPGVPVVAVSVLDDGGLDALRPHLASGLTLALLGPSGAGKSSLINALAGNQQLAVTPVREHDGRGRHTTTHRELVLLPGGAMLIDTPGMRELGLMEGGEGLGRVFGDIEAWARDCRFRDCAHGSEPDCEVRRALATGALDPERWESYGKLSREAARMERLQAQRERIALRRARHARRP